MSLSKKANNKRMRAYRKAQAQYVRGLEAQLLAAEADNTLLRAMLVQAEETGFSPQRETEQDKRILHLESDMARLEVMLDSFISEDPYRPVQDDSGP